MGLLNTHGDLTEQPLLSVCECDFDMKCESALSGLKNKKALYKYGHLPFSRIRATNYIFDNSITL